MALSSTIMQFESRSSLEVCRLVASKVKHRRLELNLTQIGLANRADINIETYRKFERSGEISFQNLVKIGYALNVSEDFDLLFTQQQYQSIDELLELKNIKRKRGKKV